jgi:uncharacterized membrane protein
MSNSCEGSTIHGVNIVVIVIGIGVSYTGFLVVNGDGFLSNYWLSTLNVLFALDSHSQDFDDWRVVCVIEVGIFGACHLK